MPPLGSYLAPVTLEEGGEVLGVRAAAGAVALMMSVVGSTGCFDAPTETKERLASVKAQGEDLGAALDGIEERLLGNQATVKLWNEMAWRHRGVSEVACENLATHAESIEKFMQKEKKKTRRRTRVAHDVASASTTTTDSRQN